MSEDACAITVASASVSISAWVLGYFFVSTIFLFLCVGVESYARRFLVLQEVGKLISDMEKMTSSA